MGIATSTPSALADERAASQNISHFDHTYDALLLAASDGLVAAPTPNNQCDPDVEMTLGRGRIIALVMKFDKVDVKETLRLAGEGPTTRILTTVHYQALKSLHWDHSVSASAENFETT